ncbi:MerR family transcriptional regulator [Virgibacillus doumboii]|uniref:MerR family transcriptional regulator n=1 Tax=Virgibacillus doumboii TaxID=2697503 RepID=UPI0013DEB18A|nr:MerR family transcriptional regulator [Virgibacillus doumboii]
MANTDHVYKFKKVISIGTVCELTGLSERKIRYYEDRGLIFPTRTKRGTRKYSFEDIENLMEIATKTEEGTPTLEIKKELNKAKKKNSDNKIKEKMVRGQINAHFKRH